MLFVFDKITQCMCEHGRCYVVLLNVDRCVCVNRVREFCALFILRYIYIHLLVPYTIFFGLPVLTDLTTSDINTVHFFALKLIQQ